MVRGTTRALLSNPRVKSSAEESKRHEGGAFAEEATVGEATD